MTRNKTSNCTKLNIYWLNLYRRGSNDVAEMQYFLDHTSCYNDASYSINCKTGGMNSKFKH